MPSAIKVEGLSKRYRLGTIGYGTLTHDLQSLWARLRGKADPNAELKLEVQAGGSDKKSNWALKDVSFEVEQGDVLGVIGKNGAGKSTLLKILSRITTPTTGTARIKGRLASLLEVGTGFHPELTGRENIYLNGTILGMTRREITRRLEEIIAFSGVEKYIDTPVKRYSSGMHVRLGFAVAAHLEPEILIVDEVLAVGDIEFQKKCLGKMQSIGRTGRTILFVSHNTESILALCSRAILLESGSLASSGGAASVVKEYLSKRGSSAGEAVWTDIAQAPGNERVRLMAVRVRDDKGKACTGFRYEDSLVIELDYRCLIPGSRLYPVVIVRDMSGRTVATSVNFPPLSEETDPYYRKELNVGDYRAHCRFPAYLFNTGEYVVDALINESPGRHGGAYGLEVLRFSVSDPVGMKEHFLGEWQGVVRPRVHWVTRGLESA